MMKLLPEDIAAYRNRMWRREPERRVESRVDAERLIEEVGFCQALTDARRPGPSLYTAVCGRPDAYMPRNVQKDPESSLAWQIKDEVMRRGSIYYGKLARGRAMFIHARLIPHFNALWGIRANKERELLSEDARAVLKALRREWEMATGDLRRSARVVERARFTRALDELQKTMKVIPGDVIYQPSFTYIWMLAEGRFPQQFKVRVAREEALGEVARAFLSGAGMTLPGELAKAAGLSRPEAGLGNHALVAEGYAVRTGRGVYRLADLEKRLTRGSQ